MKQFAIGFTKEEISTGTRSSRRIAAIALTSVLLLATAAGAHTISWGFENAGSPGAVNFWAGTYHTTGEAPPVQGNLLLTNLTTSTVVGTFPFTMQVGVKPAGLVDGTTNFFANCISSGPLLPAPDTCYSSLPVKAWQGVTVTGLTAGDYSFAYDPAFNIPSAKWAPWNNSIQGGNVVTIDGSVIGGEPNVPDGAQVGSMTTGILRQAIPTPAPGTTCTASVWSGKRSDGAGTWGMWAMQITNGTFVWNILPTERLAFQTDEWEFFERADFTIPAWLGTTLYFQLNGYFGWESFDDVSLDCGAGNELENPSFELPEIPDGEWSPAFGNPPPEDWIRINGSGHFNPNTTQFLDFFL